MLRLLLLRHSKAMGHVAGGDLERGLHPRGERDALRIGQYLQAEMLVPDLAFTSHARRARETLELALHGVTQEIAIAQKKELYLAPPRILLGVVNNAPADARTLLIVGHNPGLGAFANELTASGDAQARATMETTFPTTALAVLDFDHSSWADLGFAQGRLERFVTPSSLGGREEA